jgi:hypothetical protein
MVIATRQFGPLEVVANFENLLNIRQTDHQPLVLPAPTAGGRWLSAEHHDLVRKKAM